MALAEKYSPGELVRAREREWVVVEADTALTLRPLTGSEADIETLVPELEIAPVRQASFAAPAQDAKVGGRDAAQLLRDALRLSLRRGAGPFRSAGRLNFEPRAYQLAPLMMALRQEVIRLLIADDVGIGKTIEAGLVLREMIDRGEIDRFTVLCPPHLVDQWSMELESKFSLPAMAVTASGAARLERDLPQTVSIFDEYPHTIVSMDFIKSERRFYDFQRACPDMVVVDEAHTAVNAGGGRQQRYALVKALSERAERHMLFLTATPHSGDDKAFHNLLGLLDGEFATLATASGDERRKLRERLAGHFIQRRRIDIEAWKEPGLFPTHKSAEAQYRLSGEYEEFYRGILDYCAEVVESVEGEKRQRLAFWGTLALMRCACSSPAAAARALKTRARIDPDTVAEEELAALAMDDEELSETDLEPGAGIDDPKLASLIATADRLSSDIAKDPKFKALATTVDDLLKKDHSPVVFCSFIATAEQVGAALKDRVMAHEVDVITGGMPAEEREVRVEELGAKDKRILVATDCLSEGINLQAHFNAVVHYDMSWNPTRHQQREGRIDRFGQKCPVVRSVLIYGENNPVDGAVLKVIIRKAEEIAKQTGVRVPRPDNDGNLARALMAAVMLRAKDSGQMSLDIDVDETEEAKDIELAWINASEQEKRSRAIFAQNTLKPEEVIPEWDASRAALGGFDETERFVFQALKRLGQPLEETSSGAYRAQLHMCPDFVRERFASESQIDVDRGPLRIAFSARPSGGAISVHRAHPLPSVLADTFLEQALDSHADGDSVATLPRLGAWESPAVDQVTWLALLRIRFRMDSQHKSDSPGKLGSRFVMAEEATAIAFDAATESVLLTGADAFELLDAEGRDLDEGTRKAQVQGAAVAFDGADSKVKSALRSFANDRADALAEDHFRVRQALGSRARAKVTAITPVDVIGLYALLPQL